MPGPHDAAGVKLLTHSPKEFPRVHDLGIAIPTGNHAFVGLQVIMVILTSVQFCDYVCISILF